MQFGVQSSMLDTQSLFLIMITLSIDAVTEIALAWCLFGKLHCSSYSVELVLIQYHNSTGS